ncbi:MAG: wax ester/triacylglycerol synthase family O-acyltransferase [Thermoleophilaceae bacterium]|nr:wax ester/triacylglycerol synthase family O-acyltransferase [Thermoleophilaceae bacterium]
MDRLSSVDSSFLSEEGWATHTHVGAVMVFEGPPPAPEDFLAHVESRLDLVPRYRQRPVRPPFGLAADAWVDDPRFNLEYHVRITALPPPGSDDQLRRQAGRVFSQHLDRSKPLWELWLVEGLDGGRFAVIGKTHSALVDGVSRDLMSVLLEPTEKPSDPGGPRRSWTPRPEPTDAQLVSAAIADAPANFVSDVVRLPLGALSALRERFEPTPVATPLNVPIGTHRRVAWTRQELGDFRVAKEALGGTVHDAYLTVVAGALGLWLHSRGVSTSGLELRASAPVSTRDGRVADVEVPLAVGVADPVKRFEQIRDARLEATETVGALHAASIAALEDFAPPTLLAQASRASLDHPAANLLAANLPGPQFPLYLLGHRLEWLAPMGFLAERRALVIAAISYDGHLDFGFLADYDAMPDIDRLPEFLDQAVTELLDQPRPAASG